MFVEIWRFCCVHLFGENATHPIAPLEPRLAALLRLAGLSPLRCRALPATPPAAHSGAFNCVF